MKWLRFDDAHSASAAAAAALTTALGAVTAPRLATAGGSAMDALPALRASPVWSKLRLTWVDERCVPPDQPDSNRGEAARLLNPTSHTISNSALETALGTARALALFQAGETPEAAVTRVDEALRDVFADGLDALLLGMGGDGHIASLFPGRAWPASPRVGYVPDSPKPPAQRITLTLPFLQTARFAALLCCGAGKKQALQRLRAHDPALPASALDKLARTNVTVFTDQEIA